MVGGNVMSVRKNMGERIFDIFNSIIMVILMLITLYPILYVAFSSISSPSLLIQHTGLLLYPKGVTFSAYNTVFKNPMISIGYYNTIFYVVIGTILNLIFTSLGHMCFPARTCSGKIL
jgi:putative aldouronate transport system permease protein